LGGCATAAQWTGGAAGAMHRPARELRCRLGCSGWPANGPPWLIGRLCIPSLVPLTQPYIVQPYFGRCCTLCWGVRP